MEVVQTMQFLRTDVRRGRAWLRLCLETKSLSACFEQLFKYGHAYLTFFTSFPR